MGKVGKNYDKRFLFFVFFLNVETTMIKERLGYAVVLSQYGLRSAPSLSPPLCLMIELICFLVNMIKES